MKQHYNNKNQALQSSLYSGEYRRIVFFENLLIFYDILMLFLKSRHRNPINNETSL